MTSMDEMAKFGTDKVEGTGLQQVMLETTLVLYMHTLLQAHAVA